jgi:uncharacterized protein Yka (UPF0111/DUF47 family)
MAGKSQIVDELGEQELLLPSLVNEALAANDQAKYLMTLLQAARDHADHPDVAGPNLDQERLACGLDDCTLDGVIERSRHEDAGMYRIPGARGIHDRLAAAVRRMLLPLQRRATSPADGSPAAPYERRVEALAAEAPSLDEDRIPGVYIDRLSSGQRNGHDSLHLLVMDLHRELNRLQQEIAAESIDGACAYGLQKKDRPLVAAFMAGVNQTRALKFDHPGLGTTATRSGDRLIIQNDIGLTDAHVLVVHVEEARVRVTYTDVHLERLLFFQNLFQPFAVRWEDTRSKRAGALQGGLYHLCLGTYDARDRADLKRYLRHLGSRLVFLIDWNRARKRLRKFVPKRVCLEVLRWAADNDCGHMGFLKLGGEQLLFEALQFSGKIPLQLGGQLVDILGPEKVTEFLKFTLQTTSEGLRAGRSEFLIREEISAELRQYIDTVHQGLLDIAAQHAALIVELAMAARDSLLPAGPGSDPEYLARTARRAKQWEHSADELVKKGRAARARWDVPRAVPDLLGVADDAADELEEVLFRLTLLPSGEVAAAPPAVLQELAGLVVQGAEEYLKAAENARHLQRGSPREQMEDFLEAVDQTITSEHQTDDAHRRAQADILASARDFRQLHLFSRLADNLEEAADALMRSVLTLRDYVLGEVLTR